MNSRQNGLLNLQSPRARKARFGVSLGKGFLHVSEGGMIISMLAALAIIAEAPRPHAAWSAIGVGLLCLLLQQWYKHDLAVTAPELAANGKPKTGLDNRISADVLGRLPASLEQTPQNIWQALSGHWQTNFLMSRLLVSPKLLGEFVGDDPIYMTDAWRVASELADQGDSPTIEPGHVIAGIMLTTGALEPIFNHLKYRPEDIRENVAWLDRILEADRRDKPFFGGIGRDWANGFAPTLNRFGNNISAAIERSGAQFDTLTESAAVHNLLQSFAQGSGGVALIGPDGIGKTSHVYALAQLLLEGKVPAKLQYCQVVGLNPSVIISNAQHPGDLEHIVLTLLNEAVQAGNIILFLDDAQLFFSDGPGSLDLTRILLPVMQSGRVRLIMAMDPSDWQRLRAHNASFANHVTPVVLSERPRDEVLDVLEDAVLGMELKHDVIVSYDALREAYRLSGRYETEQAYPGKALQLLEQALGHAEQGKLVTGKSVQQAIEQTRGVKASAVAPVEAEALLRLEDTIHQRMINQTRAVKVVAAALRRARAGVSSPNRPIGSFLFLGPTGVGKTELAKAIAATYFQDEANMVRLDMSEYQRPEDVARLLSDGKEESNSLILAVRRQPFTVVLLDEIEKAHPNILNLLLQLLDEGQLTDNGGRKVSFRDCIVICTSNAGADSIRQRIEKGEELASFEKELTDELINKGQFKPELLNRFDEIVLFRPLKPEELAQVVRLMLKDINKTLANQNITVELTDAAVTKIVETGNDPRLGARPMRRMLQRTVEDSVAAKILAGQTQPGDTIMLDADDLAF